MESVLQTISQFDDTLSTGRELAVMGGDDQGNIALLAQGAKELENFLSRVRIKVAGGFIGQDKGGLIDQSSGDRDPLLLAAGEFIGAMMDALAQSDPLEQVTRGRLRLSNRRSRHPGGKRHILERAQLRQQVVSLKYKTNTGVAQLAQRLIGEMPQVLALEIDVARVGQIEPPEQVEQGALPCSRRAAQSEKLARLDT